MKWKERSMKGKILLALVVMSMVGVGTVSAIWLMGISTPTINANVISSESSDVLSFSVELTDIQTIDATNQSISETATGEILNSNGNLTGFNVTITDNVTDVSDSCTSNNDITTEWEIDGVIVNSSSVIDLNEGTTPITWTVSAVQSACPGSATGQLSLSQ